MTTPAVPLKDVSGLPVALSPEGKLEFLEGLPKVAPAVRRLDDMRDVLYQPTALEPDEMYFMYRGITRSQDAPKTSSYGLRYDITVLVPARVGSEFTKTAGHFHPKPQGSTLTYPEVYEVLYGEAHYLLQRHAVPAGRACSEGINPGRPEEVIVVKARVGEKVLIPPNYGHVTINAGSRPLAMANWVADGFTSIYEPFKKMGGAAYYLLDDGRGETKWHQNKRYLNPPPIRFAHPADLSAFGLLPNLPLYQCFFENPTAFGWLKEPAAFKWTGVFMDA